MYNDDEYVHYQSARKIGKPMGPSAPHLPNKAERKLLTEMMRKSGQSEEEIRGVKGNRQKLAKAAKSSQMAKPNGHRREIEYKRLTRSVANKMGIPTYDPRVHKAMSEYFNSRKGRYSNNLYSRRDSYDLTTYCVRAMSKDK